MLICREIETYNPLATIFMMILAVAGFCGMAVALVTLCRALKQAHEKLFRMAMEKPFSLVENAGNGKFGDISKLRGRLDKLEAVQRAEVDVPYPPVDPAGLEQQWGPGGDPTQFVPSLDVDDDEEPNTLGVRGPQ